MAGYTGFLDFTGLPVGAPLGDPTAISGAVVEVLTSRPERTQVTGALIEVLTALDITSTHIHGAMLEVLIGGGSEPLNITGATLEVLIGRLPTPLDVPLPAYTDIAEQRFGRDLVLTYPDQTVGPTASGDWPTVAGRPNLHAAMRRRLVTTPGQLVHRAAYGGGLELYVGTLNSSSNRARLAAGARANVLRDRRISEAQVSVGSPEEGLVVVALGIQPSGEVEAETVSIVSEG